MIVSRKKYESLENIYDGIQLRFESINKRFATLQDSIQTLKDFNQNLIDEKELIEKELRAVKGLNAYNVQLIGESNCMRRTIYATGYNIKDGYYVFMDKENRVAEFTNVLSIVKL